MMHDMDCDKAESKQDSHIVDKMLESLKKVKQKNFREKVDKAAIRAVISTKYKLGLGVQGGRSAAKQKKAIKWSDELAEELQKPLKKKFKERKVVVHRIDETWAVDLVNI